MFFSISHHLSMVGHWPSSSLSTGCVVSLRGDCAIFCHAGSGRVGRMRSAREKSREILRRGREFNPGHREDRQQDIFVLPLSYHDPGHREDRQRDIFILPLSYHDPGHREDRQRDIFILPLSYHNLGRREDSEIYSFSHWPIMTDCPKTKENLWVDFYICHRNLQLTWPIYQAFPSAQID